MNRIGKIDVGHVSNVPVSIERHFDKVPDEVNARARGRQERSPA